MWLVRISSIGVCPNGAGTTTWHGYESRNDLEVRERELQAPDRIIITGGAILRLIRPHEIPLSAWFWVGSCFLVPPGADELARMSWNFQEVKVRDRIK